MTNNGFTLIEIALVLLVIGVAFLGIMGLGRGGQDSVREADNTARCDNLASALFETLEIYNQRFSKQPANWTNQWFAAIENNSLEFPPVAGMSTPNNIFIVLVKDNDNDSDKNFYYVRAMKNDSIYLNNWHPYYALQMATDRTSSVFSQPNMFHVRLHILPDGDTYSSDERIYTTTLIQHGGLQ
ncbi:MAG: prepilin-type N-terminal cleavage/methylation domain-containing protein [Kiritimatiellia bacterium]